MNTDDALREYHRRIGEIFDTASSPFRIAKQIWALHAEMERRIIMADWERERDGASEKAPAVQGLG